MFIIPCQTQDVRESGLGIDRQEKQSRFHLKDIRQQSLNAASAGIRHELLLVSEVRQQRGKRLWWWVTTKKDQSVHKKIGFVWSTVWFVHRRNPKYFGDKYLFWCHVTGFIERPFSPSRYRLPYDRFSQTADDVFIVTRALASMELLLCHVYGVSLACYVISYIPIF